MAVRASRAERVAQQRFDELRNVALTFMFDIDQKLAPVPGTLPARTSVLDAAGRYLDELAGHANRDEVLLTQLGQAQARLAGTLDTIGDRSGAARAYDKSLSIFRALHDAKPDDLPSARRLGRRSTRPRDRGASREWDRRPDPRHLRADLPQLLQEGGHEPLPGGRGIPVRPVLQPRPLPPGQRLPGFAGDGAVDLPI